MNLDPRCVFQQGIELEMKHHYPKTITIKIKMKSINNQIKGITFKLLR